MHTPDLIEAVGATDHVIGPEHAPVTVIEYGDFECPNCKQAVPAVKLLLARFDQRVRFVFRHFPLEEIHPHALQAAEAAECAAAQGKFWEMHDLLFERQRHLKLRHLFGYAEKLGLDMARFTAELDDEIYLQRVREHRRRGERSGVRGTPGFFVNGRIQDVSYGLQWLFDAVEAELHASRAGIRLGGAPESIEFTPGQPESSASDEEWLDATLDQSFPASDPVPPFRGDSVPKTSSI